MPDTAASKSSFTSSKNWEIASVSMGVPLRLLNREIEALTQPLPVILHREKAVNLKRALI
eukprot:4524779-Pyramimonas_sp.AAC.1